MATQTPNLNLVLPDYDDKADVSVLNENFRKIDTFSGGGKVEEWLEDIQEKADASLAKISQDANAYLSSMQKEATESLSEIQEEATESLQEIENKAANALASIPDEYEDVYNRLVRVEKHKAAAIIDTSSKAASHELYAQDGNLQVTLHGYTNQAGIGDPSPDNVREISGLGAANIRTGGKNLLKTNEYTRTHAGIDWTASGGKVTAVGTVTASSYTGADMFGYMNLSPGTYTLSGRSENISLITRFVRDGKNQYIKADKTTGYVTFEILPGDANIYVYAEIASSLAGTAINESIYPILVAGSVPSAYEPYNATTQDMPMLPDGQQLYEGDTVVNDWASGCDIAIEFDGSDDEGWIKHPTVPSGKTFVYQRKLDASVAESYVCFSDQYANLTQGQMYNGDTPGVSVVIANGESYLRVRASYVSLAEFVASLAANPLTVYYRSADYKPENELRLCRVERKKKHIVLTGNERYNNADTSAIDDTTKYRVSLLLPSQVKANSSNSVAGDIQCNMYPTVSADQTWIRTTGLSDLGKATNNRVYIYDPECAEVGGTAYAEKMANLYEAGTPVEIVYPLATPEVYCTDARILPSMQLMPETVCGSGKTEVKYHHDTKHYIDQKFDALAAALVNS